MQAKHLNAGKKAPVCEMVPSHHPILYQKSSGMLLHFLHKPERHLTQKVSQIFVQHVLPSASHPDSIPTPKSACFSNVEFNRLCGAHDAGCYAVLFANRCATTPVTSSWGRTSSFLDPGAACNPYIAANFCGSANEMRERLLEKRACRQERKACKNTLRLLRWRTAACMQPCCRSTYSSNFAQL